MSQNKRHEHYTPKEFRRLTKDRDSSVCQVCRKFAQQGQADHIHPLWRGGTNILSNSQWLCQDCHKLKTRQEIVHKSFLKNSYRRINAMVTANDTLKDLLRAAYEVLGKVLQKDTKLPDVTFESTAPKIQQKFDFEKNDFTNWIKDRIEGSKANMFHMSQCKDNTLSKFNITHDQAVEYVKHDSRFKVERGRIQGSLRVTLADHRSAKT